MFFSNRGTKPKDYIGLAAAFLSSFFETDDATALTWCEQNDEFFITFPFCCATQHNDVKSAITHLWQEAGLSPLAIRITQKIASGQTKVAPVKNVRNIIAVSSGKGGVGKSTTSVNLAYALQQEGAKVGILDADIYGPSIPVMLGNPEVTPSSSDNKHMQPPEAYGLVANSIGYLVPAEDAAVWRGPMASKALAQIINETLWPTLDYLIVDMPPGTGDIQLSMAQQVPLTAAVVVTTPQDLALIDAKKGISMFEKVKAPVLGIIENMSYYLCPKCGDKAHIFDKDGGQHLAQEHGLPLLGQLPLNIDIRQHADGGKPLLVAMPNSEYADIYREVARSVSLALSIQVPVSESGDTHIKGDPIGINNID